MKSFFYSLYVVITKSPLYPLKHLLTTSLFFLLSGSLYGQVGADGSGAYYTGNRDIDARHEGVTFENATFADGIKIFNTKNVTFINCTFQNNAGYGVRFRKDLDTDDTQNVAFINCRFLRSMYDNVNISRDDSIADRVLHKDVRFDNCYFEGWGTTDPVDQRRFYHAIYAKCPNFTVTNSEFNQTVDEAGHAVSLRSSARVTNNVFRHSAIGLPAISYTPKNLSGTPDMGWNTIIIFNNLIYSARQNVPVGLIHLETQLNENINPNNLVESIALQFNTMAILPGAESEGKYISCIRINEVLRDVYISVYANLLVDGRNNPAEGDIIKETFRTDYLSNNVLSTNPNEHFVDWQNGNFRLKSGSGAIGTANDEMRYIVPTDLAGNPRSEGNADAGAYMYTESAGNSGGGSIVIRAKSSTGSEQMRLQVDNQIVATWENVSTTATDYTYEGYQGGEVYVLFDNDGNDTNGQDRNLLVDYITVCGNEQSAEQATLSVSPNCTTTNEGFVWLYCNGSLSFGNPGCSSNARINVAAVDQSSRTNLTEPSQIHVYPNPVSVEDELWLQRETSDQGSVMLYSSQGQLLRSQLIEGTSSMIDVSDLSSGTYYLRLETKQGSEAYRFVVP